MLSGSQRPPLKPLQPLPGEDIVGERLQRWPGPTIQDISCANWPETSPSSTPLRYDYYSDYKPHAWDYSLPPLSPTPSPCSSARSTESPPVDYIWNSAGFHVLYSDQNRHLLSSSTGGQDRDEIWQERHGVHVKSEPIDAPFIIDTPTPLMGNRVQAPTATACPSLRASYATEDMKKMMGVFRLDPSIFNGRSYRQKENTTLKEEPEFSQFYLDFDVKNVFEQCYTVSPTRGTRRSHLPRRTRGQGPTTSVVLQPTDICT